MRHFTAMVVSGFGLALATPALAQENVCGNAATRPQIFEVAIKSPESLNLATPPGYNPGRGRLSRSGIEYFSGNSMRLELVADRCTYIKAVRIGSVALPSDQYSPVNFQASPASSQPSDNQKYGHQIHLFLPVADPNADGNISITVGRVQSPAEALHNIPVVRAVAVEVNDTPSIISVSNDEIFNSFAKALHDKFGESRATIIVADGKEHRIYDYDPTSLGVATTQNGIAFGFKAKYDTPVPSCDPTVRVSGEYQFKPDPQGRLKLDWVNAPRINFNWAGACAIAVHIPLVGSVADYVARSLADDAAQSVQKAMETSLSEFITGSGQAIFKSSSTRQGELLLGLAVPMPSVTLRIPYDPFNMQRPAATFGPNERLAFLASDLGMNDAAASGVGTVSSAPNGLPADRPAAWKPPRSVARSAPLYNGSASVGRLLIRPLAANPLLGAAAAAAAPPTYLYSDGCVIKTRTTGRPRISFGVNDSIEDAGRLRSIGAKGYRVRIHFIGTLPAPQCRPLPGPVIEG
jgi:hypothetical protein